MSTDVSEVRAASIIRVMSEPPVRPVVTPRSHTDIILAPTEDLQGLNSILSHSHTIPLSRFYFGPPTHLPLARFLAYRHSFPIGQPSPLDSYITSDPFALGSLIALMMEAARTSETSVNIQLRIWQYIPEDSELLVTMNFLIPHDRNPSKSEGLWQWHIIAIINLLDIIHHPNCNWNWRFGDLSGDRD
jgi:hypothetical protein